MLPAVSAEALETELDNGTASAGAAAGLELLVVDASDLSSALDPEKPPPPPPPLSVAVIEGKSGDEPVVVLRVVPLELLVYCILYKAGIRIDTKYREIFITT